MTDDIATQVQTSILRLLRDMGPWWQETADVYAAGKGPVVVAAVDGEVAS